MNINYYEKIKKNYFVKKNIRSSQIRVNPQTHKTNRKKNESNNKLHDGPTCTLHIKIRADTTTKMNFSDKI